MRKLFVNRSLPIQAGHAVSGTPEHAQILRVTSGRVWVTVEGVPDDYWLSAGESIRIMAGRLTVIEADRTDSRVEIPCPMEQRPLFGVRTGLRQIAQRVAGGKLITG